MTKGKEVRLATSMANVKHSKGKDGEDIFLFEFKEKHWFVKVPHKLVRKAANTDFRKLIEGKTPEKHIDLMFTGVFTGLFFPFLESSNSKTTHLAWIVECNSFRIL